jgi:hypothetical protein
LSWKSAAEFFEQGLILAYDSGLDQEFDKSLENPVELAAKLSDATLTRRLG